MASLLLDDIALYLQEFPLGLTFGSNLFAGLMPNAPYAPDDCVAIYESSGMAPEYVMGAQQPNPAISRPELQVVVRSAKYQPGRITIEQIAQVLEGVVNQEINGTFYERLERIQEPFLMHRDAARRTYFACNFAVMRSPSMAGASGFGDFGTQPGSP
jgi:hypothetical protein